jgi:hypothetical protein
MTAKQGSPGQEYEDYNRNRYQLGISQGQTQQIHGNSQTS